MQEFKPIDDELGIEEYPGYIGMTWDGEISMLNEFRRIKDFKWDAYSELVQEFGDSRHIEYRYAGKNIEVIFHPFEDLAYLLDQLTTVEVRRDDGATYGGMASGSGFIFFVKDTSSLNCSLLEVSALVEAVEQDYAILQQANMGI